MNLRSTTFLNVSIETVKFLNPENTKKKLENQIGREGVIT